MTDYIDFEKANETLQTHPFVSKRWNQLTEDQKKGVYDYVIDLLENHAWKGAPLTQIQSTIWPRYIECQIIIWENQQQNPLFVKQFEGSTIVLPSYWITGAMADVTSKMNLADLLALKSIGIGENVVGPLTQKFAGEYTNVGTPEDPLPYPLWQNMMQYSTLGEDDTVPFKTIDLALG
jgi:hypothetical protein